MKTNYILIDFENVQPKDLDLLQEGPFQVKVFLGPSQAKKIPTPTVIALQSFGARAEYICLEAGGSNALDFHIAYYLGALASQDCDGFFHIISKDAGFDPLIKHLKGKGRHVYRATCIADIPFFKPPVITDDAARVDLAISDLIRRKAAKPRTEKSLRNTLNALFGKKLSEQDLAELITALCERGIVKIEGTKVSYLLATDG
jgi:hypothetical protein